jgi:hypothetical protein
MDKNKLFFNKQAFCLYKLVLGDKALLYRFQGVDAFYL